MRRSRDRRVLLPLCLGFAVALAAPSAARAIRTLGSSAGHGSTSPAALAGRYERASAPGAYVDVHGPFTAAEVRLVVGYRDAEGRLFVAPR